MYLAAGSQTVSLCPLGMANLLTGPKRNLMAMARTWWNQFSVTALQLLQANRAVCGFHLGHLDGEVELISRVVTHLLALYNQGHIKPRIDSVWPFEKVSTMITQEAESDSESPGPQERIQGQMGAVIFILVLRWSSQHQEWSSLSLQVADAMRQMQEKKNVGKVLLVPGPEKET